MLAAAPLARGVRERGSRTVIRVWKGTAVLIVAYIALLACGGGRTRGGFVPPSPRPPVAAAGPTSSPSATPSTLPSVSVSVSASPSASAEATSSTAPTATPAASVASTTEPTTAPTQEATTAPTATPAPTTPAPAPTPTPTASPTPVRTYAPAPPTAGLAIYGKVTDAATGQPIDQACITLGPPIRCFTTTDPNGNYVINLSDLAATPGTTWDVYALRNTVSPAYGQVYSGKFVVSGVVQKNFQLTKQ